MTYRDNDVIVNGVNGWNITGGTYTVKELSITPGQDPDNLNYPGQVVTMQNNRFRFRVGRSASATVANWFNPKLSGYNDPSVNGDRTTFDHTAGQLNFAFIGDLQVTISGGDLAQPTTVKFPDVAFAQGRSGLSNNWWFGQKMGQHTRDSDGPQQMLLIGTDSNNNTVYASFRRGGNDVNEVSLRAFSRVAPPVDRREKVQDVVGRFNAIPVDGTPETLSGFPITYDPITCHWQGYTQSQGSDGTPYVLLTHNVSSADYAHIVCGYRGTNEKWGFKTYLKNWRHPGGVQAIGDYLLVPNEDSSQSHIAMYDLRSLKVQELRRIENFDMDLSHKAGALGITNYTDANGTEYYLLIIAHLAGSNSIYYIYRAPASQPLPQANFSLVGSFGLSQDFQGFGLVTGTNNKVYLIGLWSTGSAVFEDYAYLYEVSTTNWGTVTLLNTRHLTSHHSGGILGVHFRYGAGVHVNPNKEIVLVASQRNTEAGGTVNTNYWIG
jgi:hypothetical protein